MAKQNTLFDRAKAAIAAFGKSGTAKGDMQTLYAASLQTESIDDLLGKLNPKKLATILQNADNGDIVEQHLLFSDMEDKDEHLYTEISKRRRALLKLDWEILPGIGLDDKGKKQAEEYAEIVRGLFDSIPDFEDLILNMGEAIGHGFAPLEIEWGFDSKYHVPLGLHLRPHHWFMLSPNERELRLRKEGMQEGEPLTPYGWLMHVHRSKGGWFARYGLFRVLVSVFLLKHFARTSYAQFLEIHGLPLRLGKYPAGISEEERKTFIRGLQALGRDACSVVPLGMEVEFIEACKASETPFATMIDHCERGMSKAILGGTLTSQADGKTSTNALGEVHNDVRRELLTSDAVQIASSITRQLLLPLAMLNCGITDLKLAPYFRFDTSEPEDLGQLADALPKLATVMEIPTAWAHEKTRIPMPEEGDPVLQLRTGATPAPEETPDKTPDKKADKPDDKKDDKERATANAQGAQALTGQGQLSAAERQLDIAMNGLDATLQPHMQAMLAPLFAEIANGLPPEELIERLAVLYPQLDTESLQQQMAQVFFVAELWGRVNA